MNEYMKKDMKVEVESSNGIHKWKTTLSGSTELKTNFYFLTKQQIENLSATLFFLTSSDMEYINAISGVKRDEALTSLTSFVNARRRNRTKTIYLRFYSFPMTEMKCFFPKEVLEIIPLVLNRQQKTFSTEELAKLSESVENEMYVDDIWVTKAFGKFGVDVSQINSMPDPCHIIAKSLCQRKVIDPMYLIDTNGIKRVPQQDATLFVVQTLACGINFSKNSCCIHSDCLENYRTQVEELFGTVNAVETRGFVSFEELENKVKSLQQHCQFLHQMKTPQLDFRYEAKDYSDAIHSSEFKAVCAHYNILNRGERVGREDETDEEQEYFHIWTARYLWTVGWLRALLPWASNSEQYIKYSLLEKGPEENIKDMMDSLSEDHYVFSPRVQFYDEVSDEVKTKKKNKKNKRVETSADDESASNGSPTKQKQTTKYLKNGEHCKCCQKNQRRNNSLETEMLKMQEEVNKTRVKMQASNDARDKAVKMKEEADVKIKKFEEKALLTMSMEKKLKEKNKEIEELKRQVKMLTDQSSKIGTLETKEEKLKQEIKKLTTKNNDFRHKNGELVGKVAELNQTVEALSMETATMWTTVQKSNDKNNILESEIVMLQVTHNRTNEKLTKALNIKARFHEMFGDQLAEQRGMPFPEDFFDSDCFCFTWGRPLLNQQFSECEQCHKHFHINCIRTWHESSENQEPTCPLCKQIIALRT
ncbi:unnamed protein product [Caenorhabditis brenneri]